MAQRKRIGINFFFNNETNSGIVNYIYNIIAALNTLPQSRKPAIVLFYSSNSPVELIRELNYPFIRYLLFQTTPKNRILRFLNRKLSLICNRNFYVHYRYIRKIDYLYPYFEFLDAAFKKVPNKIHWLVDFNNLAFPEHYGDNGLGMRQFQEKLTQSADRIVLSSYSLLKELKHYFPNYNNDVRILPFASTLPDLSAINNKDLFKKYDINTTFFISPNQFWEHKNQVVVVRAMEKLFKDYPELDCKVIFTGSMSVNRGSGLYIEKIRALLSNPLLKERILVLGVLPRHEQLFLMSKAIAIIQPSLYEGWSTLVEEAKALNKSIILSDLPVHREQNPPLASFFDPNNYNELALLMYKILKRPPVSEGTFDYSQQVGQFAERILTIFE